ncbi:S-adenosyl-L-methionine-dependent methyltransferase [Xylariales sp. PMI_506]|nr:S-adenosyl-L-methionine-dependent methyltransferase [Xylariales sp. PMI_506]
MAARDNQDNLPPTDNNQQSKGIRGIYHVPLPVLPSEVLDSYSTGLQSSRLHLERDIDQFYHTATPMVEPNVSVQAPPSSTYEGDKSFSIVANDLINKILDRTPTGGSVVDPESVIGESLRLYHGYRDGKYLLPNDAAEQDRLDLQYELFRIVYDGRICLAPLSEPPRYVLDIGTGTGIWAFEFAEQNPSSYVIGTDLSAIQPDRSIPNCEFVRADIEEDWVFPEPNPDHQACTEIGRCEHNIKFNYIHLRFMFTCFNDQRTVMKHAFDNMAPGGWIEYQESTLEFFQANPNFPGDALLRWGAGCTRGAAAAGRDLTCVRNYKQWLEEIGFVQVTERKFLFTIGEWSSDPKLKLVGRYCLQNTLEGLHGVGWKMLRLAGMSGDEIEDLIDQCRVELRDPRNHVYGYSHVIYGRKP